MARHSVVIVGGGTGGISVAARLRLARPDLDVAIVEPSEFHDYQPLWTLVGGGVFEKEDRATATQRKDFLDWVDEMHSGLINAHSPMLLDGGIKMNWNPRTQKDAEFTQLRQGSRDVILAVAGVMQSILGITDVVNYATALGQKRVFIENTVLPIVVDYGGQYSQLIARRVRECGVFSELLPHHVGAEEVRRRQPKGLILSGGPASVYADDAPGLDPGLLELGIPVLGICYGMQLMAHALGGRVEPADVGEYGRSQLTVHEPGRLLAGQPRADALREAQELFSATMAEHVIMSLDDHDRLIAYVLGLSHAVNIAFFTALAESGEAAPRLARLSSTTFDAQLEVASAVASESPALYFEIQALNDYGLESLDALAESVERIRSAVRSHDARTFEQFMVRGRAYFEDRAAVRPESGRVSSR